MDPYNSQQRSAFGRPARRPGSPAPVPVIRPQPQRPRPLVVQRARRGRPVSAAVPQAVPEAAKPAKLHLSVPAAAAGLPPRIVALYKTFSGHEFLAASLASVYDHVDAIVMAHSDVGWDGRRGNTVRAAALAWCDANDAEGKVTHVDVDGSTQDVQYAAGLAAALAALPDAGFVMLVDTDEVWDADQLRQAKARAAADCEHVRFACAMHTYVKSPVFRVYPPEPCRPTVFLRVVPGLRIAGPRGNLVDPTVTWHDLRFHHFTYCRETDDAVLAKIRTSTIGDGCRTLDLAAWRREKWDALPWSLNFHTTVGHAHAWARIVQVAPGELPDATAGLGAACCGFPGQFAYVPPQSIVIPTCKPPDAVAGLIDEINRRSVGEFEVFATCRQASASVNRNLALERAKHDLILMVDDDIADLSYGWNLVLASSVARGEADMASARLMKPDGQLGQLMGGAAFEPGRVTEAPERKLATACVAFWRQAGLRFDENFVGSGWEDDDICAEMLKRDAAARFVVDGRVLVTHLNEQKAQGGANWERNKTYFHRKWSGRQ